jgi:hypothetical protein
MGRASGYDENRAIGGLEPEEVQVGSRVGDHEVAASYRSRVARAQDSLLERRNLGGDVGDSAKEEQDAKRNSGNPFFKRCDRVANARQ